ncbi:MAG: hypothetical protein HY706_05165 [Candidatus Hydrogenedentes bacterium]|nr:hypothetical protein [Candidatus Hydrogenedentota bacterium]
MRFWVVKMFVSVLVGLSFCMHVVGETMQVREDFAADPGWIGVNNVPDPGIVQTKTQDFGFSATNYAGGAVGEIGGRVCRSFTPAAYWKNIPNRTLEDRLAASGRLSVTESSGGAGVLIGWFNHGSRGWRTPNSLAFRIDGESGKFRVFFEYGTQNWQTGGGQTFEGPYQTTKTPLLVADGTAHLWRLEYDPSGAGDDGEITFYLDDQAYTAALLPGHKAGGAVFDRFGILNQQISGTELTVYLDDVRTEDQSDDFTVDPHWEGVGNKVTFQDRIVRPFHDFGYRNSNRAGGQPGEAGGIFWRIESWDPEHAGYYAAPVGRLNLNQPLRASGKLAMQAGAADSALLVGWFNSRTYIGGPPANFLGILIEGPSRIGHYFRPIYHTSDDIRGGLEEGPLVRADDKVHNWSVSYDPSANNGIGKIVAVFDGESLLLDLTPAARKGNAAFDRFGFLSWQRGGHCVEMHFDDLEYTAEEGVM